MFAATQIMGTDLGYPDVCLTPSPAGPVPIPYPNIAMAPTAVPAQVRVFYMFTPAHNMATNTVMTNGDNAGVATGVASGTVMGPRRNVTGSFKALIGGMPGTRLTSVAIGNNTNCPGVKAVPGQVRVIVLSA
jgi:hypothetical protein